VRDVASDLKMQASDLSRPAMAKSDDGMTGYRQRFFTAYVSSHLGTYRTISSEAFARDRRVFRQHLGRFLPAHRDAAILDLGCGYGSLLHFLQSMGYGNTAGIDVSEEQVGAARTLGIRNVEVAEAADFLRRRAGRYDLITALDVLEHFTKDEAVELLDLVLAALRSGGRVVLRVPNGDSPFASWIRYGDFTHELIYTPTSIRQVLRVVGFTDVEVYPVEPVVHGAASAARWLLWKGITQLVRLYLLIEQGTPGSGVFTANLLATATRP